MQYISLILYVCALIISRTTSVFSHSFTAVAHYFHSYQSFFSKDIMRSFQSLFFSLLLAPLAAAQIGGVCNDPIQSQSNPLATRINFVTGTTNGSTIVLPIDYTVARSLIPSQYPILQNQYKQWLPSLPANQYPVRTDLNQSANGY